MITFEKLKNYAEKTGKNFTTKTIIKSIDNNNSYKKYSKTIFSIELKPNVLYIWQSIGLSNKDKMVFSERFSFANGKSIKTANIGHRAENLIK